MVRTRTVLALVAAGALLVAAAPIGLAQPGGPLAAFRPSGTPVVDGHAFGQGVAAAARTMATSATDVTAGDEVAGAVSHAGGMPAQHALSGAEFGAMVSALARSAPTAAAAYFRALTPAPDWDPPTVTDDEEAGPGDGTALPGVATVHPDRPGRGRP
jgi:hypothetical protein